MKIILSLAVSLAVFALGSAGLAKEEAKTGEALYKRYCASCHPDGGNIINPAKTLHQKDREANGVKNEKDIINSMRNPGPGMTKFDQKTVPDPDAKNIAQYILKTF
jgi:cytochrome c6